MEMCRFCSLRSLSSLALATGLLGSLAIGAAAPSLAQSRCEFLQPVGGNGVTPIITKTISMGNIFGRPNWNTDFYVTKPYNSYKFFFTADSSVSATYPVEGYLKFSDGSNMQVINDPSFAPPMGTGQMWGPFPAYPDKTVTQLNFKIGASADQAATGFTYRISTQGCF